MIVGYARSSTVDQHAGLEAQQRDLAAAGVERTYTEQTSSIGPREGLEEALDFIRSGDTLVVTKLDRVARSIADLCAIVAKSKPKAQASKSSP